MEQSYYAGLIDKAEYLLATNNNLAMIKSSNTAHFNAISAIIYLYRVIGGNDSDITLAQDSSESKSDSSLKDSARINDESNLTSTQGK